MGNATAKHAQKYKCQKNVRGHTDLNHGPIGLQPIALPLSYIPFFCLQTAIIWDVPVELKLSPKADNAADIKKGCSSLTS